MVDSYTAAQNAKVIDLHQAAKILSLSYSTVLRLARSGELPAYQTRRVWRTTDAVCYEFVERSFRKQRELLQTKQKLPSQPARGALSIPNEKETANV